MWGFPPYVLRFFYHFFFKKMQFLFCENQTKVYICIAFKSNAQVAELVDALVSNTSGATRAGSIPALGTKKILSMIFGRIFFYAIFNVNDLGLKICEWQPLVYLNWLVRRNYYSPVLVSSTTLSVSSSSLCDVDLLEPNKT